MPGKTVLILFAESRTVLNWPEDLGKETIENIVDWVAESFEKFSTSLVTSGAYDSVIELVDDQCTYQNLTNTLVTHTLAGDTIDLVVLGHGSTNRIILHGNETMGPAEFNALRTEAYRRNLLKFNIRLVFMCNCFGATLNQEWRDTGARVAVGSVGNNYMPEPMTSKFLIKWTQEHQSAQQAATEAYDEAVTDYWLIPVPMPNPATFGLPGTELPTPGIIGGYYATHGYFESSRLEVKGDSNLTSSWRCAGVPRGRDETMFSEKIRARPPYLRELIVAQPVAGSTPSAMGSFSGQPPNVRYSGTWVAADTTTRTLATTENGWVDPERNAVVFLRFGPVDGAGQSRRMNWVSLQVLSSPLGGALTCPPCQTAVDAKGPYYWTTVTIPGLSSQPISLSIVVDGSDAIPHDETRVPSGDRLDSEPATTADVDFSLPAHPFTQYTPGPDRTHKLRMAARPERDALEPNDTLETATLVDLRSSHSRVFDHLSIVPGSDVDYFRVLVPGYAEHSGKGIGLGRPQQWGEGTGLHQDKIGPEIGKLGRINDPLVKGPALAGNRYFTVTCSADRLRVAVTAHDVGEGTPRLSVDMFDRTHHLPIGASVTVTEIVGQDLPSHELFVKVGTKPLRATDYALSFEFKPGGCSVRFNAPKEEIKQIFKHDPGDPLLDDLLTGRWVEVDDPAAVVSQIAETIDEGAILDLSDESGSITGVLVGLGRACAEVGSAQAPGILDLARRYAGQRGDRSMQLAALRGLEKALAKTPDTAQLANIRAEIRRVSAGMR